VAELRENFALLKECDFAVVNVTFRILSTVQPWIKFGFSYSGELGVSKHSN